MASCKAVRIQESKIDGTKKFLFELSDGNVVESVWMQYKHGNSVCISSQVGRRQVNVYYHLEDSGRTHLQQLLEDYYTTANAIQQVLKYTVTQ